MARSYANNPIQRADTSVTVTPCGDGSYCCGNGTKAANCCDKSNGLFIDKAGNAVRSDPSAAASHTSVSSSGTAIEASKTLPPAIASVTVTPSPAPAKKDNTGVIAGVVVAVVVVLAAVGIGAFIVLRKRRRERHAREHGGIISYEGKKYSEMPHSEAGSGGNLVADGRRDASDTRIQEDAELDGAQRYEIQDQPAQELARERGPVIRHELGAS